MGWGNDMFGPCKKRWLTRVMLPIAEYQTYFYPRPSKKPFSQLPTIYLRYINKSMSYFESNNPQDRYSLLGTTDKIEYALWFTI